MTPVKITGKLPSEPQYHNVPSEINDGVIKPFYLGKDIDGNEITAAFGSDSENGLDYSVVGRAWIHEGGLPVKTSVNTVGKNKNVRITNPNTGNYIEAQYITSGKERG